jgi:PAS domain S-box-containing protein
VSDAVDNRAPRSAAEEAARYADALRRWLERARQGDAETRVDDLVASTEAFLAFLRRSPPEDAPTSGSGNVAGSEELAGALDEVERQQRRYRALFDHALMPYLVTDRDGTIREANVEALSLLGADAGTLEGARVTDYLDGGTETRSKLDALTAGTGVSDWEATLRTGDVDEFPVEVSAQPLDIDEEAGGRRGEILWALRDLRPRLAARQRQRELQREQAARNALEQVAIRARFLSDASARLTGLLDPEEVWTTGAELAAQQAAAALLVELDPEGETVVVRAVGGSGAARRDLDALHGQAVDLAAPDRPGLPLDAIRSALRAGEPEVVPAPEDPPDALGACIVVPLRVEQRTLGAMVVWLRRHARIGEELLVARNLAERIVPSLEAAALFQEVIAARSRAEAATAAEADFLSVISHELRTPLTAIISYAELLEDRASEMPAKLSRYARQMSAAAAHQRQLVEQILSYRRTQREGGQLELEKLDFRKIARSAVAMVAPQCEGTGVSIEAILPDGPVRGVSDRGRLQQILVNLLNNAIRHTDEGQVVLTLEPREPWVVLKVSDTGSGIPPEDLPRIFDRFFRGAGSHRDRGGSGLGLTITRELVTGMAGEIDVESEPGAGTAFTVRLPRISPGAPSIPPTDP